MITTIKKKTTKKKAVAVSKKKLVQPKKQNEKDEIAKLELAILKRIQSFLNGRKAAFKKEEIALIENKYPSLVELALPSKNPVKPYNKKLLDLSQTVNLNKIDFKTVYNRVFLDKANPAAELFRLKIKYNKLEKKDIAWMRKMGIPIKSSKILIDYLLWPKEPFAQAILYQVIKISRGSIYMLPAYTKEESLVRKKTEYVRLVGVIDDEQSVSEIRYLDNENEIDNLVNEMLKEKEEDKNKQFSNFWEKIKKTFS